MVDHIGTYMMNIETVRDTCYQEPITRLWAPDVTLSVKEKGGFNQLWSPHLHLSACLPVVIKECAHKCSLLWSY